MIFNIYTYENEQNKSLLNNQIKLEIKEEIRLYSKYIGFRFQKNSSID